MLPVQVPQPQLGMPDHLAAVELFLSDQDLEQSALARPVPTDKSYFHIIGDRDLYAIQGAPAHHLTLVGIPDL